MEKSVRRLLALAALGLAAAVVGTAEEAPPFSRMEWLAAQAALGVPFSSGLLPARPVPPSWLRTVEPLAAAADDRAARPRQVSSDLLVDDPGGQAGTQAEPYLGIDPEDGSRLVAGWQENRFEDGGARSLGVAVSENGGRRWRDALLPELTAATGGTWDRASDPWVEMGLGGRAYYASLLFETDRPDNAIAVSVSADGGVTWGPPVEVYRSELDFNDKEALTVDRFPASRFAGRVYVAWDINVASVEGEVVRQELVVAHSTDDGASYRAPKTVRRNGANIGAVPRVGPDGTVHLVWGGADLDDELLSLAYSRSSNGGRRWDEPRFLETIRATGVEGIRGGSILPSFAVDATTGDLYVAWADARWTGVDQATLLVSRDGGESWIGPVRVSDGPDDAPVFTVSVAVDGEGDVGVSYYTLENDPTRSVLVDHEIVVSHDRGSTFGDAIRVTRKTFDIRDAATARGHFLGDYAGLVGAPDRFQLLFVTTRWRSAVLGRRQPDAAASWTR